MGVTKLPVRVIKRINYSANRGAWRAPAVRGVSCREARASLGRLRLLLVLPLLFSAASCSGSSQTNRNTISPYDLAFEPEEKEGEISTTTSESELLEQATQSYDRGLYSLSKEQWTQLREQYPGSYYATLAELKVADCHFFAGDYATAITSYEEFIKLHPAHEAVPYCRFQVANAHREQWSGVRHDPSPLAEAVKHYRNLVSEFPESEFAAAARRSLNSAREELSSYEVDVARYYMKQGQFPAARERLIAIQTNYPDTALVADGTVKDMIASIGEVLKEPAESGGWSALLDFGRPRTPSENQEYIAKLQAEQTAAAARKIRAEGKKGEEQPVREASIRTVSPGAPATPQLVLPLPAMPDEVTVVAAADSPPANGSSGGSTSKSAVPLSPFNRSSLDGPVPPQAPVLAFAGNSKTGGAASFSQARASMQQPGSADVSSAPAPRVYALTCEVTRDGSMLFTARTSAPLRTEQSAVRSSTEQVFRFVSAAKAGASTTSEAQEPANDRCDVPGASLRISEGATPATLDAHLWMEQPGRVRVMHLDRPDRTLVIVLPQ